MIQLWTTDLRIHVEWKEQTYNLNFDFKCELIHLDIPVALNSIKIETYTQAGMMQYKFVHSKTHPIFDEL